MTTDDTQTDGIERRQLISRLGTAGVAAVGVSGVTTARRPEEPDVNAAFADSGVLDTLASEGYLDEPDVSALGTSAVRPGDLTNGATGAATLLVNGERWLVSQRDLTDGQLRVFRNPDTDREYAVVDHGDGRTLVTDSGTEQLGKAEASSDLCPNYCETDTDTCGAKTVLYIYEYSIAFGYCLLSDYECDCFG